ncbi:MAG: DUF6088 family protein [Burkholderiaceae bacterium]
MTGRFDERPPTSEKVIEHYAEKYGETVVPHGAAATASWLGLTTQVPVKDVFLTSGPTRTLRLGACSIELNTPCVTRTGGSLITRP